MTRPTDSQRRSLADALAWMLELVNSGNLDSLSFEYAVDGLVETFTLEYPLQRDQMAVLTLAIRDPTL